MRLIAVFFVVIPWEESGVRGELFVSGHRQQWHPSLCQHVPRPQDVIRKGSQMDLVFALISHDGLFYWLIPLDKHNTTHKQSTKCWDEFERTHKYSYSRSSTQPLKTHGLKQHLFIDHHIGNLSDSVDVPKAWSLGSMWRTTRDHRGAKLCALGEFRQGTCWDLGGLPGTPQSRDHFLDRVMFQVPWWASVLMSLNFFCSWFLLCFGGSSSCIFLRNKCKKHNKNQPMPRSMPWTSTRSPKQLCL